MKKLLLLVAALLSCAIAWGRPQYLQPTHVIRPEGHGVMHAALDGDWIVASMLHRVNIDPNDPDWTFDWWEKIVVFHRTPAGQWQIVQTLADEYAIYNNDDERIPHHDVAMKNGVLAFATNSGLQIHELVSGVWVPKPVVGAPPEVPFELDFDGATLLAGSETCSTVATAYSRQADGTWVANGQLAGLPECDEFFYRDFAVNTPRALVYEDVPNAFGSQNDRVRVFNFSGGAWQPGPLLPPPPFDDQLFGPTVALSGDVAMVAGGERGTHVYRRGSSGFTHAGNIPLLVSAFDWIYASDIELGPQFSLVTYPGPFSHADIAVLQPNFAGGFDHVATLGGPQPSGQYSLHISGRRVVAVGAGLLVWDLPETFGSPAPVMEDFESAVEGWATPWGRFSVAQRGATHVFRSSAGGNAVAVHPADFTATTITADIRPNLFQDSTRWVGLMARYIDENNHYYLTIRGNNTISIRKKVGGVITDLVTTWPQVELGKNQRVTFEVAGHRLAYYVDGVQITSVYDDSLTHGRAGLRSYKASADFDNVIISPMPFQELARHHFGGDIGMFEPVDGAWSWGGPFQLKQSSTTGLARILHGHPTEDQVLRVTARLDGTGTRTSGSQHWIGAFVRYRDTANYYYVTLRSSNLLSLRKLVNGAITELATRPFTLVPGRAYDLRIEAIGDKLVVYVNEEVMLEARDAAHARGRYGVVTYRAEATFSNYGAWQP